MCHDIEGNTAQVERLPCRAVGGCNALSTRQDVNAVVIIETKNVLWKNRCLEKGLPTEVNMCLIWLPMN